jgi:hypothetical protein
LGRRSRKRSAAPEPAPAPVERPPRLRGEQRDAALRAELEPLAEGERPGAVTIAAVVSFVMAIANVAASLAGADLGSKATGFTVISTVLLLACAGGMWFGARYWAVLGFMMILVFQILTLSFAIIRVEDWWAALIILVVLGLLGWLFFKLIRALARIQMPDRPGR